MKLKIGGKLYAGFGAILVLILVFFVFGYERMRHLQDLEQENARRGDDAVESAVASGNATRLYQIIADSIINRKLDETHANWAEIKRIMEKDLDQLDVLVDTEKERDDLRKVREDYSQVVSLFEKRVLPEVERGEEARMEILRDFDGQVDELVASMHDNLHLIRESLNEEKVEAKKNFDTAFRQFLISAGIFMVFVLFASIAIAFLITRSIVSPLRAAVSTLKLVSGGDLTVQPDEKLLKSHDEAGDVVRSVDEMVRQLDQIVSGLKEAIAGVSMGSEQLSTSAQTLSQGATEQASGVEEVMSAIEEMNSMIEATSKNSNATEEIANRAAKDAGEGGRSVSETVEAMKNIAEKIAIIEEIAHRTNLLSLNASIEAARAGEYGKGFAVVAMEVKKLAERSQLAASEISTLSARSVDIAGQAGNLLQGMIPHIQKTSDLVSDIARAGEEMYTGSGQIQNTVEQLNTVVQQNAAAAEELAATSEELNGQAMQMKETMGFFKTK